MIDDDAEFAVILDAVVARTKVESFRTQTDRLHPDFKPGMREAVVLIYQGKGREPKAEPPVPASPVAERVYPLLLEQAGNAIRATAAFLASGCKMTDSAEAERRLSVCRSCEFFVADDQRCRQCGCAMHAKVLGEVFKCPVGKW